jgi:sec-independent protein translocase protein TatA
MVVLLVALIVFGPKRLPEMARSMGKMVRSFQRETSRAMSDLKEGLEPINVGIFDEPDAVTTDPVGAGAVEPVADVPATRRKTSTPPARRATTTRSRASAKPRASAKKSAVKRSAAKSPARRSSGASKSRRRA